MSDRNLYDESGLFGQTRTAETIYEPPPTEIFAEIKVARCRICGEQVIVERGHPNVGSQAQQHVELHLSIERLAEPLTADAAFRRARGILSGTFTDWGSGDRIEAADGWRRLGESLAAWEADRPETQRENPWVDAEMCGAHAPTGSAVCHRPRGHSGDHTDMANDPDSSWAMWSSDPKALHFFDLMATDHLRRCKTCGKIESYHPCRARWDGVPCDLAAGHDGNHRDKVGGIF